LSCLLQLFYLSFFPATASTGIYTLSLHDALPIFEVGVERGRLDAVLLRGAPRVDVDRNQRFGWVDDEVAAALQLYDRVVHRRERSEEHTSELQSRENLVCRLLLEKKKYKYREDAE